MRYLLAFLILISISCKPNPGKISSPATKDPYSFGKYFMEYTKGEVSVKGDLIFRMSGNVIDTDQVGKALDKDLYDISPSVKGEAYWKDVSTIVFSPEERLEYNSNYIFTIKVGALFDDVPSDFQKVTFPINTKDVAYDLSLNTINYDPIKGSLLSLNGRIISSDYVNPKEVESLLNVSQKGNYELDILWNHSSYGDRHDFEIVNIKRQTQASEVVVKWKDDRYNSGFSGQKKLTVLPKGEFQVISAETIKGNARKIVLSLSESIQRTQNLEGLIKINGYTGDFKYDIAGSKINVYPQQKVISPFKLKVNSAILNSEGKKLEKAYHNTLSFDPIKPAIRLVGKGVIVPYNEEIIFPFEAINLKGAKVEIVKIFSDNVLQFLQYNRLNTTYGLEPVGRIVYQEHITLTDINADKNDANYVRYTLDLSKLISPDPGAIYQVRLGFSKNDVAEYACEETVPEAKLVSQRDGFTTIMNQPRNYNWSDRDNPCKSSYYNNSRFVMRNVLGSNIGIIAKLNKVNQVNLILSDLRTTVPIDGATVQFYDFQQQEITTATAGADGMLSMTLDRKPAFASVQHEGDFGYINLQDRHANSLSEFEVSGKNKQKGIDGYIYGERGVWRPGDTLFLNFVLEDKQKKLPSDHPVVMVIKDSKGKEKYRKSTTAHAGHIYHFPVATDEADPTGNWTATLSVGANIFRKTLKVETVKPNRLKIKYDLEEDSPLTFYANQKVQLSSQWLHGAPADGLKAKVDLQIRSISTRFKNYDTYNFDDPARKVEPLPITIFEGPLNENGQAMIQLKKRKDWNAPGKLQANFKTKVFEKGGNFSEDNFSTKADLYGSYVGIKIPRTRWGSKFIQNDEPTDIPIVVLDTNGNPIPNRKLKIGLYEANWNWWYSRGYSGKYNYNSSTHNGALTKAEITTDANGKAMYNVEFEEYGNYMIRVCDEVTGHCTGDLFYTGYSWSRNKEQNGPQQLLFTTDKKSYSDNEDITIKIPSNEGAKILLSIENGEKVLDAFWVDGQKEETQITIPATAEMNANVYLHAHLVQPHNNGANDLPMRMYGVVPISVIDKATQIEPELNMPEVIKPNQSYTVKVSEKLGRPMSYTLAVVDEGLLDLTRYKTPDLWNHFYAKQALGIKTWDIYDMVLDGYGGTLDRLISIGGDGNNDPIAKGKKANRFVPVVTHLGPFTLPAGEEHTHELYMPNYVGSVRTMVVARHEAAYGKAEKTTPVKKPLMILATLPRVLGPNETLSLPTNVFAMEDKIKNVNVSVETSPNVSITNGNKKQLVFDKIGDKQAYFDMKVGNELGAAQVKVRAQGNGEGAYDEVNINIRNPNPYTSKVYEATVQPGEEWEMDYTLFGTDGTNEGILELSTLPPMNFGRRLKYLIRYPYGCIEQTTSAVFPQLYLDKVTEINEKTKYKIDQNINRSIERLSLFRTGQGGFAHWPGGIDVNQWGTNYALHFLLEAKEKGYYVPQNILNEVLGYQENISEQVVLPNKYQNSVGWIVHAQAYRLYTLAKAGRANIGAMNIMRNYPHLSIAAAHMLAASYALIGKKEIAKSLVSNKELTIKPYVETGYTYGSHVRDMAMMAEAQQIIGNTNEHAQLIKQIARDMNSQSWYSTQTTAYALLSLGKFLAQYKADKFTYEYAVNGGRKSEGTSAKPTIQEAIDVENAKKKNIVVKNTSEAVMFVKFVLSGQLPPGKEEPASSSHIKMNVTYMDIDGKPIDHTRIKQGTDFVAKVTIQNLATRAKKINEVALSQIFPSGWEIQNDRLSSMRNVAENSSFDYRDVRDDRVYTFFDIYGTSPVTFSVLLNATYAGKFYQSPIAVEAMYDNEIQAKTQGTWVEVIPSSDDLVTNGKK